MFIFVAILAVCVCLREKQQPGISHLPADTCREFGVPGTVPLQGGLSVQFCVLLLGFMEMQKQPKPS